QQSRRFQRRCFLAAAPEDEGIATLQPAYPFALPYEVDEHPVDGLLLHSGFADSLADRDEPRFLSSEIAHEFGYVPVSENYFRLAEKLLGAKREQPRVAGTRPHNVSFTLDFRFRRDDADQFLANQSFGLRHTVRQDVVRHGSMEKALPEAAPFLH